MNVVSLTAPQQTEAATLQTAVTAAQTALVAARRALEAYLKTTAGATTNQRVQLTTDGKTAVVLP